MKAALHEIFEENGFCATKSGVSRYKKRSTYETSGRLWRLAASAEWGCHKRAAQRLFDIAIRWSASALQISLDHAGFLITNPQTDDCVLYLRTAKALLAGLLQRADRQRYFSIVILPSRT